MMKMLKFPRFNQKIRKRKFKVKLRQVKLKCLKTSKQMRIKITPMKNHQGQKLMMKRFRKILNKILRILVTILKRLKAYLTTKLLST